MKKLILISATLILNFFLPSLWEGSGMGCFAQQKIPGSSKVEMSKFSNSPAFITFKETYPINENSHLNYLKNILKAKADDDLKLNRKETDKLGFTHFRYQQFYKNYPVEGGEYLAHIQNGKLKSANGLFFDNLTVSTEISIDEKTALQKALDFVGAKEYQWQNQKAESLLKKIKNNQTATYFPKGELVIVAVNNDLLKKDFRLAYKFDIYASDPMSRAYIYIDAKTGDVIHRAERIRHTDVIGTAKTYYSGWQTITTDSVSSNSFKLQESGRGGGVETIDDNTSSVYTDSDNIWADTSTGNNAAYDGHWAAEGMYDMLLNDYGRSSYDNADAKLIVNYGGVFSNAYWDGTTTSYGTGNGTSDGPWISIDVVGHEFGHGVTEYSAALVYSNESGGLNESYSDIFGTLLEYYLRPTTWDWAEAEEVFLGGSPALRYMDNPNAGLYPQPDTYLGTNWDPFMEVHNISGVQNFWFYLLSDGGTGNNDNGDAYNVTGISIAKAGQIAYRSLAVYLTSNSQYADSRTSSIQAARDLYGDCSQEVIAVTNAWYAVGVGNAYSTNINADFSAASTFSCAVPTPVSFVNTSDNANIYLWNFGDGTTDTARNPIHTYTAANTYNVKLKVTGTTPCPIGSDSITKNNYITITNGGGPIPINCMPGTTYPDVDYGIFKVSLNTINNSTTSGNEYQDYSCSQQTNLIAGMQYSILVETGTTDNENVRVWADLDNNGSFANSELIFSSDDKLQYHSGNIVIPGAALLNTPLRMRVSSDVSWNGPPTSCGNVYYGQVEDYAITVLPNTLPPVVNFGTDKLITCDGSITFSDSSFNIPTSWIWDFGDGNYSTAQNPTHTYSSTGYWTIKLKACNSFGCDSIVKTNYIEVLSGGEPIAASCSPITLYPYYADYGIFNVTFNTINNSSGSAMEGYQSYVCAARTNLMVGQTYPIYITTGSMNYENVRVWIDYNNDGDFNVFSEQVFYSDNVLTNHSGNITIPSTAVQNTTLRMRVADDPYYYPEPCASAYYGQFEDYTVVIYPNTIPPVADFSFQLMDVCQSIMRFTDQSIINPTSWNWDFGDGSGLSASQNPYYTFTQSGTYTITLIATNAYGSDTITKTIVISMLKADFTYSNLGGNKISFTDNSSGAIKWKWDFGDGYSSKIQNPQHTYSSSGTYTVKLTDSSASGCAAQISKTINVTATDINNIIASGQLTIYPNPTANSILINYEFEGDKNLEVRLLDLLGQELFSEKINANKNYKKAFDFSQYAKGIYLLKIADGKQVIIRRVAVQ